MGGLPAPPFVQMSASVDNPGKDTLSISGTHPIFKTYLTTTNTAGKDSAHERLITEPDRVYPSKPVFFFLL